MCTSLAFPRGNTYRKYANVCTGDGVRVSITDIARVAEVSPSTVSRALSDHPRISDETKERICQLAEEMGYTPSLLARSLVTQDTATIGVVITEASDPYIPPGGQH